MLADARPCALLAQAPLPIVLADFRPSALLALAPYPVVLAFRMAFAQGVALVLECGWIKGLGLLFLQLLPLVLPINT